MTKQADSIQPDWYATWWQEQATYWATRTMRKGPRFSIVMPCYNTPTDLLGAAIDSIRQQYYENWELCIADDGSSDPATRQALADHARADDRIRLHRLERNSGIAAASNAALSLANGDYVLPMDHDDLLPPFALSAVATHLLAHPTTRFAYSDSDRITPAGERGQPFFKPDWNYDLFLAQNYLNHLTVVEATLLREIGGWRSGYDGSQDYDLYLRLVETIGPGQISHIPGVLYHWRETPGSVSQQQLANAVRAARKAIEDHLTRTGKAGSVTAPPGAMIYNHVRWALPEAPQRVSLILAGPLSHAMERLRQEGYEGDASLSVDIQAWLPDEQDLPGFEQAFAASMQHDAILLLSGSAGTLPLAAVKELVARCLHEGVGCTAPKCADEAGLLLFQPHLPAGPGRLREARLADEERARVTDRGAFASLLLHQEVEALSSPALVFRPAHLEACGFPGGQYKDIHAAMANFCRAVAARGFRNVWNGALTLYFDALHSEPDESSAGCHDARRQSG